MPVYRQGFETADRSQSGGYVTDHIYPQNKEWCGLNVKGNLVLVDKAANASKGNQDIETFLMKDTKVLQDLDAIGRTRKERLEKIQAFQAQCGYDPQRVLDTVKPLMQARYDEIRKEQEQGVREALGALDTVGIHAITSDNGALMKSAPKNCAAELVFHPGDEAQFKKELLRKKKAHFVLTYASGAIKTSAWNVDRFDAHSNLRANIQSRPFWRNRSTEGLVKVEVLID